MKNIAYVGLEVEGRTFLIHLKDGLVEERKEKCGCWRTVIDARFSCCGEGGAVFDEHHQLIENKAKGR